jgi:hypothetical protein
MGLHGFQGRLALIWLQHSTQRLTIRCSDSKRLGIAEKDLPEAKARPWRTEPAGADEPTVPGDDALVSNQGSVAPGR